MKLAILLLAALPAFGAYANGYTYRRTITINSGQVTSGPHTDFPVLVAGTYSYLATVANGGLVTDAQGDDIIFTASDGTTVLKHEVELYTDTSGLVAYWVKVPSVDVGTVIYIYYGNASVTTTQADPTNVWNSSFKGVWHLRAASGADSIASGHTFNGLNTPTSGTGQIDGATTLNGTNQSMRAASSFQLSATPNVMSFSAWVKPTSVTVRNYIFATSITDIAGHWFFEVGNVSGLSNLAVQCPGVAQFRSAFGAYPTDGAWHHVAFTKNGAGNTGLIYIDGVSSTVTYLNDTTFVDSVDAKQMGERTSGGFYFGGLIDEYHYSSVVLSAGWINTEYKNQFAPGTFYAVGSEETFNSRRRITVVN